MVCKSAAAYWLPGHLLCLLCSIYAAPWIELLHFCPHSTHRVYEWLQCITTFCFSRQALCAGVGTGATIMRTSCLNNILSFVKKLCVARLSRISIRFQDILDMLVGYKLICWSNATCVDYVSYLDGHSHFYTGDQVVSQILVSSNSSDLQYYLFLAKHRFNK